MRSLVTSAFLLKKKPLGEKDLVLVFLTADFGKLEVISRSCRAITSRRGGQLHVLNQVKLELYRGPHAIILKECQVENAFGHLKNDLSKILFAQHLAELLMTVVEFEEENTVFYHYLAQVLEKLSAAENQLEMAFLAEQCKLKLLQQMGLMPEVKHCQRCNQKWQEDSQAFLDQFGHLVCAVCSDAFNPLKVSFATIKLVNFLLNMPFLAVNIRLEAEQVRELRALNGLFWGNYLHRDLHSDKFLPAILN